MKELPERIRFKVKDCDEEHVVVRALIPLTMGEIGYRYEANTDVPSYFAESLVRVSIETGHWTVIEEPKPFEIPASPFYVRATNGTPRDYKVDVNGLRATMTSIESGEVFKDYASTREIPGFFKSGAWISIDPPAPDVDPVVAAAAEVQRLLREQVEAKAESDRCESAWNAAQEARRNIGRALKEAWRALEKANHDAAGVACDE